MECPVCKRRATPSRARNDSNTNNGGLSSTDAVIEFATNTAATAQSSPVNNDNSQPPSGPRTSSASSPHYKSVTTLSAALESLQSRSNKKRKNDGYQLPGETQVDHQSPDVDDSGEVGCYSDETEAYGSSGEEEDRYECPDEHAGEDLEDDEEDLQEEDDDDDWEEYVD